MLKSRRNKDGKFDSTTSEMRLFLGNSRSSNQDDYIYHLFLGNSRSSNQDDYIYHL